ncbi:glycosyltransferase family 4 protein [Pelosinus fermentans]|uniref:Glycosyl transferase group 1 n=1 Tax=Pelosinus fermentans JBW45 TaxID=1192197 RepID=I9NP00_9FIRM|nr:glycosyltransferase family 1 protein [Pelosinus fermentans]AJQ26017.1 glycosyl transferase group 1 [Pelosinus fermentans JBW45]
MKLLINISMLGHKPTGLGVYSEHCANFLDQAFNCSIVSSFFTSKYDNEIIKSPSNIGFGVGGTSNIERLAYLSMQFPKEKNSFIYNPTHHGVLGFNNQIITIHDLIPIHHPMQHKLQYLYFKYYLSKLIKDCKAIFTVSQTAKEDICGYYKLKPERVFVVPNGVDSMMFSRDNVYTSQDPYLLVVGAAYHHKNIHELLNNWQVWKGKYKIKVASASGKYGQYLKEVVRQCKLEKDVEFLGYVTQTQLIKLYQGCKALVFPSLWEGFGLPPIETLACGRPVIVSDIPVHMEILQDAAIYITPGNPDTWGDAFVMLEDKKMIECKLKLSEKVIKKYTWDSTGEILIKSLLQVEPNLIGLLSNR